MLGKAERPSIASSGSAAVAVVPVEVTPATARATTEVAATQEAASAGGGREGAGESPSEARTERTVPQADRADGPEYPGGISQRRAAGSGSAMPV